MTTHIQHFSNEQVATHYWSKIGRTLDGRPVVSNELEYLKSGKFAVVTVTKQVSK